MENYLDNDFKDKKFKIIRNFLDEDFVRFIQQYFFIRFRSGDANESFLQDDQTDFGYSFYGDSLCETILDNSVDHLSKITGIKLLPTYSFVRLYQYGDELKLHRDRPECEISATLSLGFCDEVHPIYFSDNEDGSSPHKIILNPGDLCLYRGCDLYHWREKLTQRWYLQCFLHYVDSEGPYRYNIYDGRKFLGTKR
tara:strand:+ start:263 stop:850 length:588 start_codon:yes stop_codon:yes gene_type:complete